MVMSQLIQMKLQMCRNPLNKATEQMKKAMDSADISGTSTSDFSFNLI